MKQGQSLGYRAIRMERLPMYGEFIKRPAGGSYHFGKFKPAVVGYFSP
jgi:hypothetical protein